MGRLRTVEGDIEGLKALYGCEKKGVRFLPEARPLYNEIKSAGYHVLCEMAEAPECNEALQYANNHLDRAQYDAQELHLDNVLKRFRELLKRKHTHHQDIVRKIGLGEYNEARKHCLKALEYVFGLESIRSSIGNNRNTYYRNLPDHLKSIEEYLGIVATALSE